VVTNSNRLVPGRRPAIAALAVALSLPLMSCATGSGSSPSRAADEAAITEFNKRYLGAINDGDIATLASLTTEEHIMIAPGRPPTVGKKANDEANGRVFTMFDIDETWTPQETVIDGNLAYQRGTFVVEATPKAGGNKSRTTGTFLRIYRRQPDGSWRMTRDMFNSDQPSNRNISPAPAQPPAPAAQ
jgi:ketosteroid isomerase-like protein